jgi:LPXTG-motif cell wall-anchored protein
MKAPAPRVILPDTGRRDTLIAIIVGALLLGFVGYGVMTMSKTHESQNILVGVVVEKQFTPQKEEQVSFSGRKIEGTKQIDGEYLLKVRVEKENRTYDVPVEKWTYDGKQKGDKLEFVRPVSEQR